MTGRHDADISQDAVIQLRQLLPLDGVLLERVGVLSQAERIEPLSYITHKQ